MDLGAVADELYGLRPRRLRRPTAAARAGNLLAREQRAEVEALLRLGESLRRDPHAAPADPEAGQEARRRPGRADRTADEAGR